MSLYIVDIHGELEGDYEIIRKYEEPTTKNDLGVEHHKQNIQAYAHDFGVSEEQAEKELRVTTKNDLGVDAISRQLVLDLIADYDLSMGQVVRGIHALPPVIPQEPKTGHCKDCKWWKDSDGVFRRGFRAESQCPMNRIEVFEGNGYCYMFEPQESEGEQ